MFVLRLPYKRTVLHRVTFQVQYKDYGPACVSDIPLIHVMSGGPFPRHHYYGLHFRSTSKQKLNNHSSCYVFVLMYTIYLMRILLVLLDLPDIYLYRDQ